MSRKRIAGRLARCHTEDAVQTSRPSKDDLTTKADVLMKTKKADDLHAALDSNRKNSQPISELTNEYG